MNTEGQQPPLLITMKQAEYLLSLDDNSIRKLLARGEIEAFKIGRALRIDYTSLVAFVERQRNRQTGLPMS